jgi:hypothetical protein
MMPSWVLRGGVDRVSYYLRFPMRALLLPWRKGSIAKR